MLEKESQLNNQLIVCDNVDLSVIFQEYESYYYLRFQKYPKVCKKSTSSSDGQERKKFQAKNLTIENTIENQSVKANADSTTPNKETHKSNINKQQGAGKANGTPGKLNTVKLKQFSPEFELTILPLTSSINPTIPNNYSELNDEKIIKPLGGYEGYSKEWKEFADVISKVRRINFLYLFILGICTQLCALCIHSYTLGFMSARIVDCFHPLASSTLL